eukprot:COSAG01_NODE_2793_length_7060_cov_5.562563_10_plen_364_part_00
MKRGFWRTDPPPMKKFYIFLFISDSVHSLTQQSACCLLVCCCLLAESSPLSTDPRPARTGSTMEAATATANREDRAAALMAPEPEVEAVTSAQQADVAAPETVDAAAVNEITLTEGDCCIIMLASKYYRWHIRVDHVNNSAEPRVHWSSYKKPGKEWKHSAKERTTLLQNVKFIKHEDADDTTSGSDDDEPPDTGYYKQLKEWDDTKKPPPSPDGQEKALTSLRLYVSLRQDFYNEATVRDNTTSVLYEKIQKAHEDTPNEYWARERVREYCGTHHFPQNFIPAQIAVFQERVTKYEEHFAAYRYVKPLKEIAYHHGAIQNAPCPSQTYTEIRQAAVYGRGPRRSGRHTCLSQRQQFSQLHRV